MTSQRLESESGGVRRLLAVALGFVLTLLGLTLAAGPAGAGNVVGPQPVQTIFTVGPHGTAGQESIGVRGPPGLRHVSATGVAAKTGGSVLSFGSRAAAREGLPGDLASAGNRFFRGATSKSQDFQAIELPNGGYRLQFFSPANNPGYGKLYVQEIDRTGQVLREYKNTMGPDGLIETKWVHGGP